MSGELLPFIDLGQTRPLLTGAVDLVFPLATRFYTREECAPVNKMDLIAAVADDTELPRTKATEAVDAVFAAISGALKKGEEVRLIGFGTFAAATRKASTCRNPRTGEEMQIPESTTVRFKVGKQLKESVN
jgi:DNA-binding protein HU-beta